MKHGSHSQDLLKGKSIGNDRRDVLIIGVGGAGANILSCLSRTEFKDARMVAADMDSVHLMASEFSSTILMVPGYEIPPEAGRTPADGRDAAIQSQDELRMAIFGSRLAVLVCGLGGGTGTGAAPVIARIAHDAGLLTAAVCVWPSASEGPIMEMNAEKGVAKLMKAADLVVVVSNKIIETKTKIPTEDAMTSVDVLIINAVRDVCKLLKSRPGIRKSGDRIPTSTA